MNLELASFGREGSAATLLSLLDYYIASKPAVRCLPRVAAAGTDNKKAGTAKVHFGIYVA